MPIDIVLVQSPLLFAGVAGLVVARLRSAWFILSAQAARRQTIEERSSRTLILQSGGWLRPLALFLVACWCIVKGMDEIFKVEQTGKGSKRRWNVWKYHMVGKGLEERSSMGPENKNPFHSLEEASAFRKRIAPNQPE